MVRGLERQRDDKRRAHAGLALALDGTTLRVHDGLRNGEPQAARVVFSVRGWRGAIEALEDVRQMLARNSYYLIFEASA